MDTLGSSSFTGTRSEIEPLTRLWILRLLVPLGGYKEFVTPSGFADDHVAKALGLGKLIDQADGSFDVTAARMAVRRLHRTEVRGLSNAKAPKSLVENVERLATLMGLTQTDCRILEFFIMISSDSSLNDTTHCIGMLTSAKVIHAISVILDIPLLSIRRALAKDSKLSRSGLVAVWSKGTALLPYKLELLSSNFAECMRMPNAEFVDLLRSMVNPSTPAVLSLHNYDHIDSVPSILLPYLKTSVASNRAGVNILIYGAPGSGKSQLPKVLAHLTECELFEITGEDEDGDPITGEARLRAFRAAQCFLAQRRSLILFDEVEDVFSDGGGLFGPKSTAQTRKAWMNRMLEGNSVPTLWVTNAIDDFDPAFIRRFDMVFELPVPPKKQRERILANSGAEFLDASNIARIAEAESLAPAVVSRAASVVNSIRSELGVPGAKAAFERLINNTLQAQGHRPIKRHDPHHLPEIYDPAFIHTDVHLVDLAQGLIEARGGRLCLYGPPGTGKTAYGRWLAEQLEVPIVVKRASDLLSPFLGIAEKKIAAAFQQAEQEGALLLIDEVDSFLQDRRNARASWEVSMVNEMLTQMEAFSGVFVASTNLMDGLDQAVLRRFDLKAKFGFLRPEQAWELLRRHCGMLRLPEPQQCLHAQVTRLTQLTPGDFAVVVRQHRFRAIQSPAALVRALDAECALKEGGGKTAIGFFH